MAVEVKTVHETDLLHISPLALLVPKSTAVSGLYERLNIALEPLQGLY